MMHRSGFALVLLSSFGLTACATSSGSSSAATGAVTREGPPKAEPGAVLYPPPFSAFQIRKATPEGRMYRWRVVDEDGEHIREVVMAEVDDQGTQMTAKTFSPEGEPLGDPQVRRIEWGDLVEHATYPAEGTTTSEVEVEVPAGSFDAWLYEVRVESPDGMRITRAWFAPELPGAPVRHEIEENGERTSLMELLEHRP